MPPSPIRTYIHEHQQGFLDRLTEWLRIPSIWADPARSGDVQRSADWLADACRAVGFPTVEIWPRAGAPTVFAEWAADDVDAPAVVVYGHHDVQPVDPEELWEAAPFEPFLRGEDRGGGGSADDKGQVAFHLLGLEALPAPTGRGRPPVTLRFVIE